MTIPFATVIGDPIAQSKSPLIHQFWARQLGLKVYYRADHVVPDALATYLSDHARDPLWRGCNVTVPHKQAVMRSCDTLSPMARRIGAVNCVVHCLDGTLHGDNSDIDGFAAPLRSHDFTGEKAVILGAGGASRAIVAALELLGFSRIDIINRDQQRIAAMASDLGIALQGHDWVDADQVLEGARLLVNATSLGMVGQPPLPIRLDCLPIDAVVNDIVYAPLETPLLAAARARGNPVIDGLEMLIGQAAKAFTMFFGQEPPRGDDQLLRSMLTS
jgi:shikimate dehydrogenase